MIWSSLAFQLGGSELRILLQQYELMLCTRLFTKDSPSSDSPAGMRFRSLDVMTSGRRPLLFELGRNRAKGIKSDIVQQQNRYAHEAWLAFPSEMKSSRMAHHQPRCGRDEPNCPLHVITVLTLM
jgi:hypothetical protein